MPRLRPLTGMTALVLTGLLVTMAGCGSASAPSAPVPSASAPSASAPSASVPSASVPVSSVPTSSKAASSKPTAHPSSSSVAPSTAVSKLLVFVVENHSLDEMQSQMPFLRSLADRYGYADHYTAATHPSLPNYLAIAGGDTFGIADDDPPASHPLSGPSVFGEAVARGSTARLYAESMPTPCNPVSQGTYAVKHNPWAYFRDEATQCGRDDVPLAALAPDVAHGRLPAVGMVIPDLCDDAHDCPLAQADGWLRTQIGAVMRGPDWRSGRLAIVVTADEDDDAHGNRILTVVAQPSLHHLVVSAPLGHFALSRAYADVAGVPPLRRAAGAPDLLRAFGLTPG